METFEKDHMLEQFFSSMRKSDKNRHQPPFPKQRQRKVNPLYVFAAGIAASLIVGVLLLSEGAQNGKLQKDQIVFILFEDARQGSTYFEIKEESSIDTWEPATQSLLDEF